MESTDLGMLCFFYSINPYSVHYISRGYRIGTEGCLRLIRHKLYNHHLLILAMICLKRLDEKKEEKKPPRFNLKYLKTIEYK